VDNGFQRRHPDYLLRLEAEGGVRVITNRTNLVLPGLQPGRPAAREIPVFLNNDTMSNPAGWRRWRPVPGKDEKIGVVALNFIPGRHRHAGVALLKKNGSIISTSTMTQTTRR